MGRVVFTIAQKGPLEFEVDSSPGVGGIENANDMIVAGAILREFKGNLRTDVTRI